MTRVATNFVTIRNPSLFRLMPQCESVPLGIAQH